jgi:hypothetical protein
MKSALTALLLIPVVCADTTATPARLVPLQISTSASAEPGANWNLLDSALRLKNAAFSLKQLPSNCKSSIERQDAEQRLDLLTRCVAEFERTAASNSPRQAIRERFLDLLYAFERAEGSLQRADPSALIRSLFDRVRQNVVELRSLLFELT